MHPLDVAGFNRFHHGGKVREQDPAVLCDLVAEGDRSGRPVTALRALAGRVENRTAALICRV